MKHHFCIAATVLLTPCFAADAKLTDDDKIEIIRGMTAEYATVKTYLPRSKKPLEIDSHGNWDKDKWQQAGRELGPAARVGDQIQITKVTIESDKILFDINGGLRGKGKWYDHIQVGMGGGGGTSPVNGNQNTNSPGGTYVVLLFDKQVPAIKAVEIKKMMSSIFDFEKHTVTENYVETLPAPVQEAIKAKKAIEGMDRDQVLLAMGRARHKERGVQDGNETEDWIYGEPPGIITFVTFSGSKVVKVRESYAGAGGSTSAPLPVR